MTAEIVIMNKSAIAMAADSAATLTNNKVYNGFNKLFQLSNNPPIGIMIYGNADCNNIPMEILIKEFRKKIKDKNLEKISDFGKELMDFLKTKCENFCDSDSYYFSIVRNIFNNFQNYFLRYLQENDDKCKFLDYLDKKYPENKFHFDVDVDEIQFKDFDDIIKNMFRRGLAFDLFKQEDRDRAYRILRKFFIFNILLNYTGIVIAGIDCEELYPSYLSYHVLGLINDKFIYKINEEVVINDKNPAHISPFAQSDVVETYLKGINSKNQKTILKYIQNFLNDFPEEMINIFEESEILDVPNINKLKESIDKIKQPITARENDFKDLFNDLKDDNYSPILGSIEHVPKEDLSNMCESLIHLTSLKRKISYDVESVGGEIDVAIISKGDGFVWTKRKHYFDGDLNPQFFENRKV